MGRFSKPIRRILIPLMILFLLPLPLRASGESGVLTFPAKLETIKANAFRGDSSIRKAVLQEGITTIQSGAFADSSLLEIQLPASLTFIADDAFENSSLQTVTAPEGSYAYRWARERRYIAEYRALLIGETRFLGSDEDGFFLETVLRNKNDAINMAAMLEQVVSPTGAKCRTTRKTNAGYDAIRSAIQTTFADTMDQDISVFFIATHGDSTHDGELMMPFNGDIYDYEDVEDYLDRQYLSFATLASWLSEMVQGKVVVILESCGAGSSIYMDPDRRGAKGTKPEDEDQSEKIVRAAVKAFAAADPGIEHTGPNGGKRDRSTGDMRLPKFYVLAAAAHHEKSWGYSNDQPEVVNLFTKWLIEGVGRKDNSPADVDIRDNILTLNELHRYVQSVGDTYRIKVDGKVYYQHVQAYPENSSQDVFRLQ